MESRAMRSLKFVGFSTSSLFLMYIMLWAYADQNRYASTVTRRWTGPGVDLQKVQRLFCASPHPDQLQGADSKTTGSGSISLTYVYIKNSWNSAFTLPHLTAHC